MRPRRPSRRFWQRAGLATGLLALGLLTPAGARNSGVSIMEADAALLAGRMRIAGKPGDLALRNAKVTAIVSVKDGSLVDFWPNRVTPPTAPQLKTESHIDGLWAFSSIVDDGAKGYSVAYADVRNEGGAVIAHTDIKLAGTVFTIDTRYTLPEDQPCVVIASRIAHQRGGYPWIGFLDRIKWGNAKYELEGRPHGTSVFSGQSRWVGRHGASGDLVLRRSDGLPMQLSIAQGYEGLASPLEVEHGRFLLKPSAPFETSRKLCYEPIAAPPPDTAAVGRLRLKLHDEKGRALASKLTLTGLGATKTPRFNPDGDESGASRFVFSGTGSFDTLLPIGRYRALVTAGYERGAASWDVEITKDGVTERSGSLPRLIETPGWISADLHLHQAPSVDADLACTTRVISVAAEGVELAVATDHYAVTDLGPAVTYLLQTGKLARPILTLRGSEISTVGERFGHFNLFPMQPDDRITYEDTSAPTVMAEMRREVPNGVIQVNHPRWEGIGYFYESKMDPYSRQIPVVHRDAYSDDFDAIEVFNGLDAYSEVRIRQVLEDWMWLLGRGYRYTATGNSDSHKLAFQDPGLPRNLIRYGTAKSDDEDLKASETSIIDAIKAGRVTVTSGPIIDLSIGSAQPGDTVKTGGKTVTVNLKVRAVPWIDVSTVELLLGPKAIPLAYLKVPQSDKVLRYHGSFKVPGHAKTFVLALAQGKKDLPNVHLTGLRPLAFTNPIWLEP